MTSPCRLPSLRSFLGAALLAVVFLCLQGAVWADAPDSLAGKVYHDETLVIVARTSAGIIVRLNADGSYNWIKCAQGNALASISYGLYIATPPADGTYTYQRNGPTTGVLNLSGMTSRTLTFATAINGSVAAGLGNGTFGLTDNPNLSAAPLLNCSVRGHVGPGQPLIAGFIVAGPTKRDFLVRVVGPSLARFGVAGTWADPDFNMYTTVADNSFGFANIHYGDWTVAPDSSLSPVPGFEKIFATVGAFPLDPGSKDAVQVMKLAPGAYTVVASARAGDPGGETLIEIYSIP